MDGNQDEPQEELAPPPFITAPVSVPSPVPVSTTPSTSSAQRKNARLEDPLAPALAAIGSRQDRSISLYKEAVEVLRSLAADVRRYVDHMVAATPLEPASVPEGVSRGATASKHPARTTATSGHASTPPPPPPQQQQPPAHVPQARSPPPPQTPAPDPAPCPPRAQTPAEHPPGRQPPCLTPSCVHSQSAVPLPHTVPQHPACPFPPQYPTMCPYHIMPQLPAVVYPAYYSSPQSSVYQFPQQTPIATAPQFHMYPPAVTIAAPSPFYPTPSPSASRTVLHRPPPPSVYPAPPSAPGDPAQSTNNCAPFSDCQSAPHAPGPPPPPSGPRPHQRRGRGWVRKRWGRRGGSSAIMGRSGGFN